MNLSAEIYPAGNKIAGWLYQGAEGTPDQVLVHSIDQEKSITWGQMATLSRRIGQYLTARGIGANDRVVLLSGNSIEQLTVYFSVMAHGATICTIQVEMNAAHLGDILGAIRPKIILAESGVDLDGPDCIDLGDWQPGGGTGFFAEIAGLADDLFGNQATEQFRDMQDSKLADSMAGDFGIADLLLKQFEGKI